SSSSFLKERRFKLSRACDRCRRRRIKCDEGHPCQACLGANSACTFEEPGKRSHPHKSKRTASLEDRMHHLESLIQAIPPAVFAAGGSAAFASPIDANGALLNSFPIAPPPPSPVNLLSITGPSAHFGITPRPAQPSVFGSKRRDSISGLEDETARMALYSSYLYLDDEGYTRWQGETSGLPICDLLIERHQPSPKMEPRDTTPPHEFHDGNLTAQAENWFPDRQPSRTDLQPERIWKLITTFIPPDLMDGLVQCYLSTSYYLLPFLHVPTFLNDYGNPQKWGEPGFAAYVVAVCCLASRHIDDPRVRADPGDGVTSGVQWFELFGKLRSLPGADRPTVYTVQAVLVAGVYAIGWGKLSRAFALLSEAASLSVDAGLHRSADVYDAFNPIEDEVRKRTFWCVYMWDKQAGAHFGRPPVIRMRDCDVAEPAAVDDEYITRDALGPQPPDVPSRMETFVFVLRYFVILEAVLDSPPARHFGDGSPFLKRATGILSGFRRRNDLREEEALCDELHAGVPAYWAPTPDTLGSTDAIRVTHSQRIHCLDQFVRMLIARHRFSEMVAERVHARDLEQGDAEREAMVMAHAAALQIIAAYLQIAAKGLMTYYGVHVIHQLTAAGRTLVAFLLNCQSEPLRPLITPALEGLRSCVGLLKRFSGRYVCGQRSGDMMEEFCRITQIPLDSPQVPQDLLQKPRPPWIRPLRKKQPGAPRSSGSGSGSTHGESPPTSSEAFSPADMFVDMNALGSPSFATSAPFPPSSDTVPHAQPFGDGSQFADEEGVGAAGIGILPAEIMALFGGNGDVFGGQVPQDFLSDGFGSFGRRGSGAGVGAGTGAGTGGSPAEVLGLVASP
ncbi:fungal-specific transcription factor domain-containing protein, partial [Vararia minispora EC-137]